MLNKIYNFLGLIQKSGNLTSGDDGVEIDIKKKKSRLIIISEDASENTKDKFINLAQRNNIKYVIFGSKYELGFYIGKSQRSVLSIKDEKLAKSFLEKLNENNSGGDSIVKN